MARLADDLARIPLFGGLNKRQLRKLAGGFKELDFAPGRAVVREGHADGVGFFVIAEGKAAVSVAGETVATIEPGEYFGKLGMITKQPRTSTVTAATPLRCLTIRFWDFREFAKANPDVSWNLLQHLAGLLVEDRARRTQAAPDERG